jgi:hypothetical protein
MPTAKQTPTESAIGAWNQPGEARRLADAANREFIVPARAALERIKATFEEETAQIRGRLQNVTDQVSGVNKSLDETLGNAGRQLSSKNITLPETVPPPLPDQADNSAPATGIALGDLGRSVNATQHISQAERLLEIARETVRNVLEKTSPPKNAMWPDGEGLGCLLGIGLLVVGGIGAAVAGVVGFIFAALICYGVAMVLRSSIPSRTLGNGYLDVHNAVTKAKRHLNKATEAAKAEAEGPLKQADAKLRQSLQEFHAKLLQVTNQQSSQLKEFAAATKFAGAGWNDPVWGDWEPSKNPEFGAAFGRVKSITDDLTQEFRDLPLPLEIPALLPFAQGRGLLFHAPGSHREHAVNAVQSLLARLLATIPPGKLRLTFFDPVSLGGHVAAFMPLADHEESLINSRAWTEPRHIEERLAEITEHMETVIQKYLRTDFQTIHDYNAAAGEVAEPFRFVVVFDFPVNFTDTAARRLVSIARNGARCGVYVIIVRDPSKQLPYGFEMSELEQLCEIIVPSNGDTRGARVPDPLSVEMIRQVWGDRIEMIRLVRAADPDMALSEAKNVVDSSLSTSGTGLDPQVSPFGILVMSPPARYKKSNTPDSAHAVSQGENSFTWKSNPFAEHWRLICDSAPPAEILSTIISRTGALAQEGMRVEVPFEKLLQFASLEESSWWQHDTARSIEVPLGPTGARRLQPLSLGTGLAHHALIVGRPGSGKSNLMHVIITTLALKYSPNEIELYLIDFKKGVEFKAYADARLPHALAIAVESEREFGFSVIERLDEELKRRGEQFKDAGVNNLAEFRAKRSDVRMPRVLLIIDEFQELFVQEDNLSRQCATLLDRIVRQGRAFGLHVMLGTQTLKRQMDLTTATFDQMAVRIALQCSDADSRLILADDNPAARLLSRPGEAIYNDSAGLLEGNNLFQVARFEDRDRPQWLDTIRQLATAAANGEDVPEPIVFEGREDAHLERSRPFLEALRRDSWPSTPKGIDLYLGEPIAIRPPVAARLRRQSGSNLLVVTRNEAEGVGMLVSAASSLLFSVPPGRVRLGLINFATADDPAAGYAPLLAELFPDRVSVCPNAKAVPKFLEGIAMQVQGRGGATPVAETFVLIIIGLQRVKALRSGFDDEEGPLPIESLRTILREGPEVGVHTLAWCDTWSNARAHLDDRLHGEFSQRVGGIMNGDDSRWLLDDDAAARLDERRCLYYDEDRPGQLVKFRPYTLPDQEWLRSAGQSLLNRK